MSGERLEILYVSREDVPGDHGGAVHTWQVASLLARLGHGVTLLSHRPSGAAREEEREGVRVLRAAMSVRGRNLPLLALPRLRDLRGRRFDVAMERFDTFGGLAAIHSWRSGAPLVLEVNYPHLEEMLWKWGQRGGLQRAARPLLRLLAAWNLWQFARARAVIAPRPSIVPEPHRDKVERVHWGANTEEFTPPASGAETAELRARLGIEGREIVVSHGSFQPWHGLTVYPEVVAQVTARAPGTVFLFLGRSRGLQAIEQEVRARGLAGSCRFAGPVEFAQVPRYLGLASLALAPFAVRAYPPLQRFGFFWSPAKVFEYMACALPVVTTDQDYLRQVVAAEGAGVCVAEDDASAMATAIVELLGDAGRRQRLGRAGREAATARYSWQAHVRQLEGILRRVAEAASSRPGESS